MLHGIKQLVGMLATPLLLALLLAALAAVLRVVERRRWSAALFALAAIVAYFGATSLVANALLLPLERQYPPFDTSVATAPAHIVVLGSYYAPRDDLPVTATLGSDGLARIVEGVRLARMFPETQLIVSGGMVSGYAPSAVGYAKLAHELGIAPERIKVIDTPRDTKEEAAAVMALIGQRPFLLVTSAAHMPRSMRLMHAAGAQPVAAPTAHRADVSRWSWRSLLPFASSLRNTEAALHEYVGLLALSVGLQ